MLNLILKSFDEFGFGQEVLAVALVQEENVIALTFLVWLVDQKPVHKQACVTEFARVWAIHYVD